MCRIVSWVVGKGCLLWPACSPGKNQLAIALFRFVLQGQPCLLLQVSLDFLLVHSNPLLWKWHFFFGRGVFALRGLLGIHRTVQFSFFGLGGWDIDLDYCDVEWFALKTNQDNSTVFVLARKYCISDSLVNYEGYSISSMGVLLTVSRCNVNIDIFGISKLKCTGMGKLYSIKFST